MEIIQPPNSTLVNNEVNNQGTVTQQDSSVLKKKTGKAKRKSKEMKIIARKKWPMLYITKEQLNEPIRQTKELEALKDRFKRRLKRFINKEIWDYKEDLIEKHQVEKGIKSQPRIDTFVVRR